MWPGEQREREMFGRDVCLMESAGETEQEDGTLAGFLRVTNILKEQ